MTFTDEQRKRMAKIIAEHGHETTPKEVADALLFPLADLEATDWFKQRPEAIQEAIRKTPPDKCYVMDTGHVGRIYSFCEGEPITCTVSILRIDNPDITMERRVFGIDPKSLTPK